MFWTCEDGNGSVLDRNDRLFCSVNRELTAWTTDPTSRPVVYECRRLVSRVPAHSGEALEMIVATDNGHGELLQ